MGEMEQENSERLLGDFPVTSRLSFGLERLKLFVTNQRLLIAHLSKRGSGSAGTTFLGRLGGALEDLFKSPRESLNTKNLARRDPEGILASNRGNFAIGLHEIINISLAGIGGFTLVVI